MPETVTDTGAARAGHLTAATAVIGAGVIGCAIAWALARDGRRVLLIDRDQPATSGASYGNAGHIATEQLEPLPSLSLLLRFWRELYAFGGPLDIPLTRLPALTPWLSRFALAAFQQKKHMGPLAGLVRGAADALESLLGQIGRRDLLRRQGHYSIWLGAGATARAARQQRHFSRLDVPAQWAPAEVLERLARAAAGSSSHAPKAAGLWLPGSAHVLDPAEVARAMAGAAMQRGASLLRATVRSLKPCAHGIEIALDETGRLTVENAVVCAGVWSAGLLAPFGIKAPLEAERGYHIELPGHAPLADAPVVYAQESIVVTPMAGRLRGTSYLELAGLNAPADLKKSARLRARLSALGYAASVHGPWWMGPRPTLPDYLPGIGRAADVPALFYAVGHQHLGLTLAAPTAELIAQLVSGRAPAQDVSAFDLARFGRLKNGELV